MHSHTLTNASYFLVERNIFGGALCFKDQSITTFNLNIFHCFSSISGVLVAHYALGWSLMNAFGWKALTHSHKQGEKGFFYFIEGKIKIFINKTNSHQHIVNASSTAVEGRERARKNIAVEWHGKELLSLFSALLQLFIVLPRIDFLAFASSSHILLSADSNST